MTLNAHANFLVGAIILPSFHHLCYTNISSFISFFHCNGPKMNVDIAERAPFLIIKLAIVACVNTGSHLDWFMRLVYIIARFYSSRYF